jgi:hypothetical protein
MITNATENPLNKGFTSTQFAVSYATGVMSKQY